MIVEEKCIDNSFFMDDDGTPYLSFVRFNDGRVNEIYKNYPEKLKEFFESFNNIWC